MNHSFKMYNNKEICDIFKYHNHIFVLVVHTVASLISLGGKHNLPV